jgi:hypothetical protein
MNSNFESLLKVSVLNLRILLKVTFNILFWQTCNSLKTLNVPPHPTIP